LSVTIRGHKKAKTFRESVKKEGAHKGYWRESKTITGYERYLGEFEQLSRRTPSRFTRQIE
jgi:hypothetical protein